LNFPRNLWILPLTIALTIFGFYSIGFLIVSLAPNYNDPAPPEQVQSALIFGICMISVAVACLLVSYYLYKKRD
jgi:hypothetical protein